MEWDVSWEIAYDGKTTKECGVVRVSGNCAVDALSAFFKSKDNKGRTLIGLTKIYEKKTIEGEIS